MRSAAQPARNRPDDRYFRLVARFATLLLVGCALLAAASTASAARAHRRAWATIDECRIAHKRATVGVLAWMPAGPATAAPHRFARIQLQYRDAHRHWRAWPEAETGYLALGAGKVPAFYGYSFVLARTTNVTSIRAHVVFAWRHGRRLVTRRSTLSSARRPSGRYGTPHGFSAASCRI